MSKEGIFGFQGEHRFLSNFFPYQITFEGLTYKSSEAAFQAQKIIDEAGRACFTTLDAREARSFGRDRGKVKIREDWESEKLNVMYKILRVKFKDPNLRKALLETGDLHLEETNYWKDTFWGVYNGKGMNHLGRLLMLVRDEIREAII